jgi:hypothetical protein
MGQLLHGGAMTAEAMRRAIPHSQESLKGGVAATGSAQRRRQNGANGRM